MPCGRVAWGARAFYFGRLALNEMSVEHMVFYRFLFACLGMLPVALLHRRRVRLTGSEVPPVTDLRVSGRARSVSDPVSRLALTTVSHASLMVGRHAGAAGRRGPALCRRRGQRRTA